jgi:putative endonuclease
MSKYYVYLTTNQNKTVLYIGVTNNIAARLFQHQRDAEGDKKSFAGKYNCFNLIYAEGFEKMNDAIRREKEIKGWTRLKKENLIKEVNPNFSFLNNDFVN